MSDDKGPRSFEPTGTPQLDCEPHASPEAFERLEALSTLRTEVIELVGEEYARGVLYGAGFRRGLQDGTRITGGFEGRCASSTWAGPALPLLFRPDAGNVAGRFSGPLRASPEAAVHTASLERPDVPSCAVSAGYAAGWYTAVLGRPILVRETACAACDPAATRDCSFEARDVSDWAQSDPAWTDTLLPFVDTEAIENGADGGPQSRAMALEHEVVDGDLYGPFDPMSPAIQVWGPVMVVPYSGPDDGEAALRVVLEDPDAEELEVAVIDVAGAVIGQVERIGVQRLLRVVEDAGLAGIVSGAPDPLAEALRAAAPVECPPLFVDDVCSGIALAFQLAGPGLREH